jgi:hypothetical protein
MKKILVLSVALIIAMPIATTIYANAMVNNTYGYIVYAANPISETPPIWYNWSDLGIVKVTTYGGTTIWIDVNISKVSSELLPLQETQPSFRWNETFYKVMPLWATPSLPENLRWKVPAGVAISAGWAMTLVVGGVFLQKRRGSKNEEAAAV